MTRDKNRDRDKSMDKSMDKIRYVPVPAEGQNEGQNISLFEERYLGKCP